MASSQLAENSGISKTKSASSAATPVENIELYAIPIHSSPFIRTGNGAVMPLPDQSPEGIGEG
ncbi:hypothetical protein D3C72_2470560 [compost metagenome]